MDLYKQLTQIVQTITFMKMSIAFIHATGRKFNN